MSKFVTRKWTEVSYLSNGQYSVSKNIRYKIPMLRSNLCESGDAYINWKQLLKARLMLTKKIRR